MRRLAAVKIWGFFRERISTRTRQSLGLIPVSNSLTRNKNMSNVAKNIDFDNFVFSSAVSLNSSEKGEFKFVKNWKLSEKFETKSADVFKKDNVLFLSAFRESENSVENIVATRFLEEKIGQITSSECGKVFAADRTKVSATKNLDFVEGFVVETNCEKEICDLKEISSIWIELGCSDGQTLTVESCSENVNCSGRFCELVKDGPPYNPIFDFSHANAIYHSYKEAMDVLDKCKERPEVIELLRICQERRAEKFDVDELQSRIKHPLVVIEGLDASGKSTLTGYLADLLQASKLQTPPPYLHHIRRKFDSLPEIIRRAYYAVGNYMVAKDIVETCQTTPVILDRFWHSTTAYAITNDCGIGNAGFIPPAGHRVYRWPDDLIKPNAVILLTVTEETREARIHGRQLEKTWEEQKLGASQLFRQRLVAAYRRMDNPPCIEVDANQNQEQVARDTVNKLKQMNILQT